FSMTKSVRRKNSKSSGIVRRADPIVRKQHKDIGSRPREQSIASTSKYEEAITNNAVMNEDKVQKITHRPQKVARRRKKSPDVPVLSTNNISTSAHFPPQSELSDDDDTVPNFIVDELFVADKWKEKIKEPYGIDEVVKHANIRQWPSSLQKELKLIALKRLKVFSCHTCGFSFHNYIHFLMHHVHEKKDSDYHMKQLISSCDFDAYFDSQNIVSKFEKDVDRWALNESICLKYCEEIKLPSKKINSSLIHPTKEWLKSRQFLFYQLDDRYDGGIWAREETFLFERGADILKDLEDHLSEGHPIACRMCNIFYPNGRGFIYHCNSYTHYRKILQTPLDGSYNSDLYALTIFVNRMFSEAYVKSIESSNPIELKSNFGWAESCYQRVAPLLYWIPRKLALETPDQYTWMREVTENFNELNFKESQKKLCVLL
ncbi:hypothetical protein PFISCL1PPCAC_14166, partial [Pristionchus fissidentatus]